MLVITGMGRSGTSVLAAACQRLGFDPGGDYHKVINAGLEDPEVVAINEAILRPDRRGAPVAGGTLQLVARVRRAVIKDPRFILAGGAALRVWWQQRQDLRVVLTTRDPEEVVRSRRSHPDWFGAAGESARVLEEDVAATVGLMTARGIPFRTLRFPDFLAQPDQVFDALRFGGLSFTDEAARDQWRRQVDYAKVRHSPGWEKPPAPKGLRRLLRLLAR